MYQIIDWHIVPVISSVQNLVYCTVEKTKPKAKQLMLFCWYQIAKTVYIYVIENTIGEGTYTDKNFPSYFLKYTAKAKL